MVSFPQMKKANLGFVFVAIVVGLMVGALIMWYMRESCVCPLMKKKNVGVENFVMNAKNPFATHFQVSERVLRTNPKLPDSVYMKTRLDDFYVPGDSYVLSNKLKTWSPINQYTKNDRTFLDLPPNTYMEARGSGIGSTRVESEINILLPLYMQNSYNKSRSINSTSNMNSTYNMNSTSNMNRPSTQPSTQPYRLMSFSGDY